MNTPQALIVASRCAELVALCARYQAVFGRRANPKAGSTNAEWQMYHEILDKQAEIAAVLDASIVAAPGEPVSQWWKRQDVIDLSVASDLHKEAARLVACCAYLDTDASANQWSYSVQSSQQTIAAQLHPNARSKALEHVSIAAD